jgi:anti-sigma regulatory factor (Ser/Thr protein kinase)
MRLPGAGVTSVELGGTLESARAARLYVVDVLTGWAIAGDVIDTAKLLTSELATNAILHGSADGGTFALEVRSFGCCIGVEVSDGSCSAPILRSPAADAESGRGLLLVAEVADSWGNAA